MKIELTLRRDILSPSLRRLAKGVGGAGGKTRLHKAMGEVVVQTAKSAFNDPSERARAWRRLADGRPARLRRNNHLARSPRVFSANAREVKVGSNLPYAAVHQLGGKKKPIPARPYFPFWRRKPTARVRRRTDKALRRMIEDLR